MNEQNVTFLQDNLKYLGFGEKLNDALKDKMSKGPEDFKLQTKTDYPLPNSKDGKEVDKMTYDLNFKKGKDSDMYFFNGYDAKLEKAGNAEAVSQTFQVNKGKGVTAKESYNLLSGRSINKDVVLTKDDVKETVNLWMKIDFKTPKSGGHEIKTFNKNYGFDLNEAVEKSTIKGLDNAETKERLIKSLERGNQHDVTFTHNGQEVKGYVSADPQYKNLKFADADLKPIYNETKSVNRSAPAAKETASETKQEASAAKNEVTTVSPDISEAAGSKRKR